MILIKVHNTKWLGAAFWPFIFIRSDADASTINHEKIHIRQQAELLLIFFYLWYGIEYVVRLFSKDVEFDKHIGFEWEAYSNENDLDYLKKRRPYSFLKYLKRK